MRTQDNFGAKAEKALSQDLAGRQEGGDTFESYIVSKIGELRGRKYKRG